MRIPFSRARIRCQPGILKDLMTQTIELREATLPPEVFTDKDEFALDVLVGLSETHKTLP